MVRRGVLLLAERCRYGTANPYLPPFLQFPFSPFRPAPVNEKHHHQQNEHDGKEADVDEQHGGDPDTHRDSVLRIGHEHHQIVAAVNGSPAGQTQIVGHMGDDDPPGQDDLDVEVPFFHRVGGEVEGPVPEDGGKEGCHDQVPARNAP